MPVKKLEISVSPFSNIDSGMLRRSWRKAVRAVLVFSERGKGGKLVLVMLAVLVELHAADVVELAASDVLTVRPIEAMPGLLVMRIVSLLVSSSAQEVTGNEVVIMVEISVDQIVDSVVTLKAKTLLEHGVPEMEASTSFNNDVELEHGTDVSTGLLEESFWVEEPVHCASDAQSLLAA